MKPLFTNEQLKKAKYFEKLPCECYSCNEIFHVNKHSIMYAVRGTRNYAKFCSRKCSTLFRVKGEKVNCKNCNKEFLKKLCEIKKSTNHFCSKSCSVTYNNTHKTYGNRRSKLEKYLEEQLTILYPDLHIDYNKKEAINSELDIYIPSLKLAIELNGIFHYEPIFGQDKLSKIQNNDERKFQACIENEISLCIIDSSKLTYFKPKNAEKFLKIILDIIKKIL